MTDQSRYLHYLPPILQARTADNNLLLGDFLRVFEKILTGIDDGERLLHRSTGESEAHELQAVEQVIADLYHLFDPWGVRDDFLPWLASWVALEFPTLEDKPLWDEYQQRRAVADMTDVYKQRGLKAGLRHSLYLHTLGEVRPRIAIDDGTRVFTCRPQPDSHAPVHALVSSGAWQQGPSPKEGLFRPLCLAFLPNGDLIVGDGGLDVEDGKGEDIAPGCWRIAAGGDGAVNRIGRTGMQDLVPFSICLGPDNTTLYVLSRPKAGGDVTLHYLRGEYSTSQLIILPPNQDPLDQLVQPVAMVARRQVSNAPHLYILDRGVATGKAEPKILDIELSDSPMIKGHEVKVPDVVEPLSLAVLDSGEIIIGAGRSGAEPGILIRVSAVWDVTARLPEKGGNPLVAPTALVAANSDSIYVLDTGLRVPIDGKPFFCDVAQDAAIYSVNLITGTIAQESESGQLINPAGMAMNDGTLFIAEPGIVPLDKYLALWRARRHEFAVTVHFLKSLEGDPRLKRTLHNIRAIADREKPAHTVGRVFSVVRGDF